MIDFDRLSAESMQTYDRHSAGGRQCVGGKSAARPDARATTGQGWIQGKVLRNNNIVNVNGFNILAKKDEWSAIEKQIATSVEGNYDSAR